MSKKEDHRCDLADLFDEFLKTGDDRKIIEYLVSNSNLPGRRANLELAGAFAEVVGDRFAKDHESLWNFCRGLTGISPDEAPVNDPMEFLPFCGAWAVGAIGAAAAGAADSDSPAYFEKVSGRLKALADDPRWRIREAVAKGIQELLERQSQEILKELESWIGDGDWLTMRAVAAGVAEPALLQDRKVALQALYLHKRIFDLIPAAGAGERKTRRSVEFKTLRKGLGYSLSVVIRAVPGEGFEYMRRLVDSRDPDILWIVKENLKKNRLIKNFPDEVDSLKELLEGRLEELLQ